MILQKQSIGLNGWWGNLWGGFKSIFTSNTGDDNQSSSSGRLGRRIAGFLNRLTYNIFEGAFKSEYVPTQQDLVILNPLKTALNNYMIQLVNNVDAYFLSNNNTNDRVNYLNDAIRKIQIIQSYFINLLHPQLSPNAQLSLSDEMILMINSFELTIEELLAANQIDYTKTEGFLAVNTADTYPAGLNIQSFDNAYGFQYQIPNNETVILSTNLPPVSQNVSLVPNQQVVPTTIVAGTTTLAQTTKSNSGNMIAFAIVAIASIALLFSSDTSEKKQQ